jgi:hypothetical protein
LSELPDAAGEQRNGDGGGNAVPPSRSPISIAEEPLRSRERALDAQSHIRVRKDCTAHLLLA